MEKCYIKSSKLYFGALMLFVMKDGKLCMFIDYHAFKKLLQLPLALD
jgi:ribosomal protein L24E